MIQLKEVLHFYLGREVVDEDCPHGYKAYLDQVDTGGECIVNYYKEENGAEICDMEPIIMLAEDVELKLRNTNDFSTDEAKDMPNSSICITGEGIYYSSEGFKWLLNNHFDLFGLIESGQAIDKKTLNK